jgi:hypothetical protein
MNLKRNPDAGIGGWLLRLDDGRALQFETESEARQAMSKLATAKAIVGAVQTLAGPADSAPDVWQEYWDLVNGGATFTDEDLEPLGITAVQLGNCINLLDAFRDFTTGQDQGGAQVWRSVINQVRRVQL